MELIARPRKPAQSHAFEAVMDFEVRKAHLDALALIMRFEEALGSHQSASQVASILVDVAGDLARRRVGATLHLESTDVAIEFGFPSAEGRLPKSLHFAEFDVIIGVVRARSVHEVGYGHKWDWAA